MSKKTISLSFKNGLANNPSDLVCDDNSLAVELGATFDENGHIPVQNPDTVVSDITDDIVIIHDFGDYTNLITINDDKLYWSTLDVENKSVGTATEIGEITANIISANAIGNTVVLNTSEGLYYILWKSEQNGYVILGNQLPDLEVSYNVTSSRQVYHSDSSIESRTPNDYLVSLTDFVDVEWELVTETPDAAYIPHITNYNDEESFKNAVIGLVEQNIKKAKHTNLFPFPFWARVAYRLYDGSYARITNPVLVMPTVRYNRDIVLFAVDEIRLVYYCPWASSLHVKIDTDITGWEDIIKGVELFVSDEVRGFNLEGEYSSVRLADAPTHIKYDGCCPHTTPQQVSAPPAYFTVTNSECYGMIIPEQKNDQAIIDELLTKSVFYELYEIEPEDFGGWINVSSKLPTDELVNLTTNLHLEHDDFFNHCQITAGTTLAYNSRLQLANISRGFFEGFSNFMVLRDTERNVPVYVEIQAEDGTRTVQGSVTSDLLIYWFYYPDPRAKKATFIIDNTAYQVSLKEHQYLNGAYYFGSLPTSDADSLPTSVTYDPVVNTNPERLVSQIITSETGNPFIFNAEGTNEVGSGKVLAISTNTNALSEGQFGQYPLIAFTSEGIWALQTNDEGLYYNVRPLSRDVCSNADTVTQTDNAIFFATKKGLMVLTGSRITCVSTLLNGKENNFPASLLAMPKLRDLLQTGRIAYDYKGQKLWIYGDSDYCYIYNIKTKAFATRYTPDRIKAHYNLYPDHILQTEEGDLLSLIQTPDINDDINTYDMTLVTRPIKFGDVLSYKTIFRTQHLWLSEGEMEMYFYGSNDLKQWQKLETLHGIPWRFYCFKIEITSMKATDSYHGMVVDYQTRHTNRMHTEDDK